MTSPARAAKSRSAKRAAAPSKKRGAKPAKRAAAKPAAPSKKRAAAPAKKRAAAPSKKRAVASARPPKRAAAPRAAEPSSASRWLAFVEQHGVVLASARGPVPSVAEAVAGEPIVGSWWAHPRGKAIFAALSELDDADDVRCFKLIDNKVTLVHRRLWPAIACLAAAGVLAAPRAASLQQEHMPTGEHRNLTTPYPDWVPEDVARAAQALSLDDARGQLGAWI